MNYSVSKLGDVIELDSGYAFKSALFGDEGGLPLVRIRDVVPGRSNTRYLGEYDSKYLISDGDMLIGMDGEFNLARWRGGEALLNQRVCRVRAKPDCVLDDYLFYFLPKKLKEIEARTPSVTVKHLSAKTIKEIEIPLPDKAEQQRIAAILGKADAIRRKRQQAIDLADEFLRAAFLDMFGDSHCNPKKWPTSTLADVVNPETSITYGIVQAGPHIEDGVKYIRTGDFKDGRLVEDGYARTAPKIAAKFERSRVRQGELVYCIRASIGAVDIVPEHLDGANLTQGTARVSPGPRVLAEFLVEQMRTKGFRTYIDRESKGATFKEITLTRLREVPVVVPPMPFQKRFREIRSAILDTQTKMVSCNDLPLFEALSQRAFAGVL